MTETIREQILDIDLKRSVSVIEADPAADNHAHPIFRLKAESCGIRAEHHRFYRAVFILERKVKMPAAVMDKILNLPAQRKVIQHGIGLQQRADISIQCSYCDNLSHFFSPSPALQ